MSSKPKEKSSDKAICQNCKNYKRPICKVAENQPAYVARKHSCEWFKRKQ